MSLEYRIGCNACAVRESEINKLKATISRLRSQAKQSPLQEIKNVRAEVQELRKEFASMMKVLQRLEIRP